MSSNKNKTVATRASVTDFVRGVADAKRRADLKAVMAMMRRATGKRATVWGPSIVGFGRYEYRYASGREGTMFLTGVSPRARNLAIYVMPGFKPYTALLNKLGKHSTGKSCLYINSLGDVDAAVLERLVQKSVDDMRAKYGLS